MRSPVLLAMAVMVILAEVAEAQLLVPLAWNFPIFTRVQDPPAAESPVRFNPSHDNLHPPPPKLLQSYYPAAMQLLQYFSERMQYKEFHTTTVAPPYTGGDYEVPPHDSQPGQQLPTITKPPATSTTPVATTSSTTTTRRPPTVTTPRPNVESTTPVHAPGLFAPVPPQYQMQLDEQVPHDSVHAPTQKPKPTTTTTTKKPMLITRRTTKKPVPTSSAATTTTRTTTWKPTTTTTTMKSPPRTTQPPLAPLGESNNFFTWFFENKRNKKQQKYYEDSLYDILDPLPKDLLNDIDNEAVALPYTNDLENLEEFLRKYDDKYDGRYVPSQTGEKRQPPTKPYVEFLVLYDLMKREAKSKQYSEYHGYSDDVLRILNLTSYMSSERQLHYVLSQVVASTEVEASSIRARMETIIKDLENPYSVTSKTLREIPAFAFAL